MSKYVLIFFFLFGFSSIFAQLKVQYGCERIIQAEKILCELDKNKTCLHNETGTLSSEMDSTFDNIITKIDYIFWVQGVIIALIIFMLGFIIWDRRTALNPVRDDVV